eukprot:286291-Pleurochrysis_carterae.AAC.1
MEIHHILLTAVDAWHTDAIDVARAPTNVPHHCLLASNRGMQCCAPRLPKLSVRPACTAVAVAGLLPVCLLKRTRSSSAVICIPLVCSRLPCVTTTGDARVLALGLGTTSTPTLSSGSVPPVGGVSDECPMDA